MKKRIFMLAVLAALVLSFAAMAWADDLDYYFKMGDTAYQGKTINNTSTKNVTISFQVKVPYKVVSSGDTVSDTSYHKGANLVKWTVSEDAASAVFTPSQIKITREGTAIVSTDATFLANPYYLIAVSSEWSEGSGTAILNVEVTGTMTDLNNDIEIEVGLYSGANNAIVTSDTIASATTAAASESVDTSTVSDGETFDPRDPDSELWDGLDPKFTQTINTTSYDYGKVKPKLDKVEKTALTFTPGTSKDLTISMLGPITELDVYIAGKDAVKLYGSDSADKETNIQLTKDNIKKYNIPFRVTSYDFATSVSGSTAKDIQKNWKKAENSVTLSFNGGNLQYKGFPITIAMSNSNTTSKPVAKAVKLNIGTNFTTPSWTYFVTSRDKTTSLDVAEAKVDAGSWDSSSISYKYVRVASAKLSGDVTAASWDLEVPADVSYDVAFKSNDVYYIIPEIFYTLSTDGTTVVSSTDNTTNQYVYSTTLGRKVNYYYCDLEVETAIGNKTKPEAVAAVYPEEKEASQIYSTFYASGDAPYAITMKPGLSDTDKLGKFFKTNEIEVVQPVYDYLGNVKSQGYVVISGYPTNTEKESKLALTLTAMNPSTKKKAAAKVTAIGKLIPTFDKTTTIDGEKWITTKRVQAGKAPSVKPKAKGSKTITYHLGVYDLEGDTLYDSNEGDDDYSHEALAAKLAALGLSFDTKKGVYAPDKTKLTVPTLNEAGDAFESLDIPITAANNVGTDLAYASIAITGAKPALVDKTVTFTATDTAYAYKTFKLKAGKDTVDATTTTANIKAAEDTTKDAVLSTYGLSMVTYDELLAAVKSTDTVASGTSITDKIKGWTPNSADYAVTSDSSGTAEAVTSGDAIIGYVASGDVTMYNGTVYAVSSPDESLRNFGIIQITNYSLFTTKGDSKSAKGAKVSVALENLGAAGKGSLKVIVPAAASSNGALPASFKAFANNGSSSSAAKAKTNGTASLTYNGALPEDADAEEAAKGTVTFGEPRTVADLTAGQQAFLAEKGCTVVAVLPEITADVSNQYKLEDIELDEEAPEGATLIWIAFPKNAPASEDDEIVDFYDEAGTPVEGVPASHKIIAEPWLREAVTYEPVIAIEAK